MVHQTQHCQGSIPDRLCHTSCCCWLQGNGFITDSNIISKYGLSDANVFFSALWDKPYVGQVCCWGQAWKHGVCVPPADTVLTPPGWRMHAVLAEHR